MTVRRDPAAREATYPQPAAESSAIRGQRPADPVAEARAFEHEHARLYDALKTAGELAELAGHDDMASELRRMRAAVAEDYAHARCRE